MLNEAPGMRVTLDTMPLDRPNTEAKVNRKAA
jgi:hypothetical protein